MTSTRMVDGAFMLDLCGPWRHEINADGLVRGDIWIERYMHFKLQFLRKRLYNEIRPKVWRLSLILVTGSR